MLCGAHRWYVTGSRASLPDAKETAFGLSTLKVKNGKVSEVRAIIITLASLICVIYLRENNKYTRYSNHTRN